MEQSIIAGFTVTVFNSYNGTQLFITNPEGVQIYAHKVSGNPLERANEVIGRETPETVQTVEAAPISKMISIRERKAEFLEAMKRGADNHLEIFNDFERDSFYVKNHSTGKEYNVRLETHEGETKASCSCPDFFFKKRLCKHISAVMSEVVFGLAIQG